MDNPDLLLKQLSSIVLNASPLIIAVCGETITERAGLINLSLDGTMLLSAMTGLASRPAVFGWVSLPPPWSACCLPSSSHSAASA